MASTQKQVKLMASDQEMFTVDEKVARMSQMITNMLDDTGGADDIVPLPNVTSTILAKIIEYCKFHVDDAKPAADIKPEGGGAAPPAAAAPAGPAHTEEEAKEFDSSFVKVDQSTLFELILAANYLNIKPLLDLACLEVANMIKGKTPEEIRKTFNIPNDFTPEEEEEVRRENQWAFE